MPRLAFILAFVSLGFLTLSAATIQTRDGHSQSGRLEKIDKSGLRLDGENFSWDTIRRAHLLESFSIPVGLQGVTAKIYRGSYPKFPDVTTIKPSFTDDMPRSYVTILRLGNAPGAILFEGKLDVPRSGEYQFQLVSDDGARLLVGGREIATTLAEFSIRRTTARVKLAAGTHDFRLEYLNLASFAILELQWKGPGFDWIPLSSVVDRPGSLPPVAMSVAGALAWNGSFIAHAVEGLAESRVRFSGKPQNIRLSTVNTSAVFFQPISLPHANRLRSGRVGRVGVLLNRGDFQEGEIKLIKDNVVTIKTLLFGEKSYRTGSEALAVFLQKSVRSKMEWTVRTTGGSEIKLQEMKWDKGMLVIRRSPFRNLRLKSADIAEISYGTTPNILHRVWGKWDAMTESERSHTRAQQAVFDRHYRSRANIRAQLVAIQVRIQAANEKLKEVGKSETAALADVEVCEKLVYTTRAKWELAQAKRVVQLAVRDDRQQAFDYAKAVLAIKKANHITANQNLKNAKKQEKDQTELAMKTHAALLASNAKQVAAGEAVFVKATEAFAKARIEYVAELEKAVKVAEMELTAAKLIAAKASADKSVADKALVTMKLKLSAAQKVYTEAETASKVAVTKAAVATIAATKAAAALIAAAKDVTGKSATAVAAKKFHEGLVNTKQKPAMLAAVNTATALAKATTNKSNADKALTTAKAALAKATVDFRAAEKASKAADATAATAGKVAVSVAATLIKATSEKAIVDKVITSAKAALTKATADFQSVDKVAKFAEAKSKAVGADPKKSKAEKDKAMTEAVAKRKLADAAKKVLEMVTAALQAADKSQKTADLVLKTASAADVKAKAGLAAADKMAAEKKGLLNVAKTQLAALTKAMMSAANKAAIMAKAAATAITNRTNADKTLAAANTGVANAKTAYDTAIKVHKATELVMKAATVATTKAKAEQIAAGKIASNAKAVAGLAKTMSDKLVVLVKAGEQGIEVSKKAVADSKSKQELAQKKSDEWLAKQKDAGLKTASSVEITAAVMGVQKSYELAEGAWKLAVQKFKESEVARNNSRNKITVANNNFNNAKRDLDAKVLALEKASTAREKASKQQHSANKRLKQARNKLAERGSLHQKAVAGYNRVASLISNARAFLQLVGRHIRDLENDQRRIQDLSNIAALAAGNTNRDLTRKSRLFNAAKTALDNAVIQREQPALKSWRAATNSLAQVAARSMAKPDDINLKNTLEKTRIETATLAKTLQVIRGEISKHTGRYQTTQFTLTQVQVKDGDAKAVAKMRAEDLLLTQKQLIEPREEIAETKSTVTGLLALQAQKKKVVDGAAQSLNLAQTELTQATANFTKVNATYDAAANVMNQSIQNRDKGKVVFVAAQLVLQQQKSLLITGEKELLRSQRVGAEAVKNKSTLSVIIRKAKASKIAIGKPLDNARQNLANLRVAALQAEATMMDRKRHASRDKLNSERAMEQQRVVLASQVTMAVVLLDQAEAEDYKAIQLFKAFELSLAQTLASEKTAEEAEVAARMEYEMLIKRLTSASQAAQAACDARAVVQREKSEVEHVMARFQVTNRLALTNPF